MSRNRLNNPVVTGIGVLSAIGCGKKDFVEALQTGTCGIKENNAFRFGPKSPFPFGLIPNLEEICSQTVEPRKARRWDPATQMTIVATMMALRDAGLLDSNNQWQNVDPSRVAVILGNGLGGLLTVEQFYKKTVEVSPQSANPSLFPETVPNAPMAHVTIELGITGPSSTITQKHTTFECTLDYALQTFENPNVDIVITGGLEDQTEWETKTLEHCRTLARNPRRLMPFDRNRNGTLLGEGGAIFVLERPERAQKRRQKSYGRIVGRAFGGVPTRPGAWPKDSQQMQTLTRIAALALERAGLSRNDIDWVNACALGSTTLDNFEARLLQNFFGNETPISSCSGATGTFLAMGSLRFAAVLLAMNTGFIPPTVGLEDPEICGLDYVIDAPRPTKSRFCFINSLADGGTYAALICEV